MQTIYIGVDFYARQQTICYLTTETVRVHGGTAILRGRANVKGRFPDGPDISGPYRYMRVFVKQQGAREFQRQSSRRLWARSRPVSIVTAHGFTVRLRRQFATEGSSLTHCTHRRLCETVVVSRDHE